MVVWERLKFQKEYMDLIGYIVPIGRNCTLLIYIERTLLGKELAARKLVAYSLRHGKSQYFESYITDM